MLAGRRCPRQSGCLWLELFVRWFVFGKRSWREWSLPVVFRGAPTPFNGVKNCPSPEFFVLLLIAISNPFGGDWNINHGFLIMSLLPIS